MAITIRDDDASRKIIVIVRDDDHTEIYLMPQLTLEEGGTESNLGATGPGMIQQGSAGEAFTVLALLPGQIPIGDANSEPTVVARNNTSTRKFLMEVALIADQPVATFVELAATDLSNGSTGTGAVVLAASPTITGTLAAAAITASSTITPSQTSGIVGTTTSNNVNAGGVGEYVSASRAIAAAASITSNLIASVVSVSLTAGDWDCDGQVIHIPGATTSLTLLSFGISTSAAAFVGENAQADHRCVAFVPGPFNIRLPTPTVRISLSVTTTVYLLVYDTFTASTMTVAGLLRCRRVR